MSVHNLRRTCVAVGGLAILCFWLPRMDDAVSDTLVSYTNSDDPDPRLFYLSYRLLDLEAPILALLMAVASTAAALAIAKAAGPSRDIGRSERTRDARFWLRAAAAWLLLGLGGAFASVPLAAFQRLLHYGGGVYVPGYLPFALLQVAVVAVLATWLFAALPSVLWDRNDAGAHSRTMRRPLLALYLLLFLGDGTVNFVTRAFNLSLYYNWPLIQAGYYLDGFLGLLLVLLAFAADRVSVAHDEQDLQATFD